MKKRFIISICFMIIGVVIYLLFNNGIFVKCNNILAIIRNYLPDSCWTFSFYFASINFAYNISNKYIILNSIYIFSVALLFELMQYYDIVEGTFDILDLIIYIISITVACLIEIKIRRNENEKSI